jgi:hypothetical protein
MSKRTVVAGAVWALLSVLAFLVDPILGACVLVFGGIGVVVVQLASSWDEHPDFEARELVRARKRKQKWERDAGKREKDAARYAAHQARQAEKARSAQDRGAVERGRAAVDRPLEVVQRGAGLTFGEVDTDAVDDLVEHGHGHTSLVAGRAIGIAS